MFDTISKDSRNPLVVYTRDELKKLRNISEEAKRTNYRNLDPSMNKVYRPSSILEDRRLQPELNNIVNKELRK